MGRVLKAEKEKGGKGQLGMIFSNPCQCAELREGEPPPTATQQFQPSLGLGFRSSHSNRAPQPGAAIHASKTTWKYNKPPQIHGSPTLVPRPLPHTRRRKLRCPVPFPFPSISNTLLRQGEKLLNRSFKINTGSESKKFGRRGLSHPSGCQRPAPQLKRTLVRGRSAPDLRPRSESLAVSSALS